MKIKKRSTWHLLLYWFLLPFMIQVAGTCYGQGVTVPAGSTLNLNTGTLNVPGSVSNSGTLVVTTGAVDTKGDWTNAGTFTAGTGTVVLSKTGGTQNLTSGGTGAGKLFYNLTHSGTSQVEVLTNALDINGAFTNSAGTFDANGLAMTVAGNWNNSATFTSGSNSVTLDGTNQSILGSTTFYNLTKSITGASYTLTVDHSGTQTITNSLTLTGESGNPLVLTTTSTPTQAPITLQSGGTQTLNYLTVGYSNASGGVTLVARNSTQSPASSTTNWVFGGTTITWTGTTSTAWNVATNWDLGLVPTSADTVVIPDTSAGSTRYPTLDVNATVTNLTLSSSSSTLTLAGFNLTVSGTFSNTGTVIAQGDETISIATIDSDSGTFRYIGNGGGSTTFNLPELGAAAGDYYNLVINDSTGNDVYQTNNNQLDVLGSLTITGGTLNNATNEDVVVVNGAVTVNGGTWTATSGGASGSIDIDGALTLTSGTITAPDSGETFTIGGNFTHSGGTFTHSSGTVTLDGTNQSLLGTSTTTFYGLKKNLSAAPATLTFTTSSLKKIVNNLDLQGTSTHTLTITSDSTPTQACIELATGGSQTLKYLSVGYSDASGTCAGGSGAGSVVQLVARDSAESPASTTTNWRFGTATMNWEGDVSTNWSTPTNWDLGVVPIAGDTARIPVVATVYPTLTANVTVDDLYVDPLNAGAGAVTLSLAGFNLTVDDVFSNNGNLRLQGGEDLTITPDTDSGTFTYIGTGAGITTTIDNLSASSTDYYNVVFNDSGASPNTFRTNGNIVAANNLTVTSGTLDIFTNGNTITTTGTLTVNGGTLAARSGASTGNIDANGSVAVTSGTLTAPGSAGSFTVAGNWTYSGGTFNHSSGTVTFDTTTTATIAGSTTFYSVTSTAAGKTILFTAGTTQTIAGTLSITGISGSTITLKSTTSPSSQSWAIQASGTSQSVNFVTLQDSNVTGSYDFYCFSCTNGTGNDNADASPHWIFQNLEITIPQAGKTVDQTPTIIGAAVPSSTVTIKDGSNNTVATTTSDTSGNYRVEIPSASALSVGANTLTPYIGVLSGASISITVVAAPSSSQQPTITSLTSGQRVHGANPPIVGAGATGQTATIVANDANGNMLLQTVGTGTVNGGGEYSVVPTTALYKGTNYISVTVDGVASNIIEVTLTDPFGVVFDSAADNPIKGAEVTIYRAATGVKAVPGVDLHANDVNPVTTGEDGFYSFLTANADYYIVVNAPGYTYPSVYDSFPASRTIVNGSKGQTFTVAGVIIEMDHPVDNNGQLLHIEKDVNKKQVKIGDVVTYTITIESRASANNINHVFIEDTIPPGFKYIEKRVTLDGVPIEEPHGKRPLNFPVNNFVPGQKKALSYQLVVGSGVTQGRYENSAVAKYQSGQLLSNRATESVDVVFDPLFDMGTIMGKVFYDRNENGLQDEPKYYAMDRTTITEDPIPNVQLMMEDGTTIQTDKDGRFHIPSLTPGRHLLRLDERSLPEGSYLTTDKVVVVDVTQGVLTKVNFGVSLDYGRFKSEDQTFFSEEIKVAQDKNTPQPFLNVSMFGDSVITHNNIFVQPAEFRIYTNYAAFISQWRLEISDADTKKVMRIMEGDRFTIYDPIFWDGRDNSGEYVRLDRNYQYSLYVEDGQKKFDETKVKPIKFNNIEEEEDLKKYLEEQEASRVNRYRDWIRQLESENNLGIQTILIEGETVTIDPMKADVQSVRLMQKGKLLTEVAIAQRRGLTARELLEAKQVDEAQESRVISMIVPKGEFDVVVQTADNDGKQAIISDSSSASGIVVSKNEEISVPVKSYTKAIKVGEDYFLFVAMGDAKIGYTFARGNVEPVEQDDKFTDGFWSEGKGAYYLKGKIKGKYLITSSFDTERQRKELFKKLNPDDYYPVYGDESSVNYDATDTQGNLYLLLEWDKSSVKWGNYNVTFDDTEFAQFSRSLYGGKVDFESLATTSYGDAKSKIIAFHARAQQKSAHVEMLATGGSLYFLKHKDVIEGSDKIKIEVRDEITGLVRSSRELKEGSDYEMDYGSGRIIFWRPVPMMVESYSLISNDLLNGHLVYVIADYEYDVKDELSQANLGARLRQAVTDNVLVGATYVKEDQQTGEYQLKGTDIKTQFGETTTVTAEFAETESEVAGNFVSTDGGLSFTEIETNSGAQGRAYGIKGDTRLFNRATVKSYYQWIDQDFSSTGTLAQQGKEVYGLESIIDIWGSSQFLFRHDVQALIDDGNKQTQLQVGAQQTATTLMQYTQQIRKLSLTGEYRKQVVTKKIDAFESETNVEEDAFALSGAYPVNDKIDVSLQHQMSLKENDNVQQTTIGMTARPTDKVTIGAEKTLGQKGFASNIDMKVDKQGRVNLTGEYALDRDREGKITNDGDASASVGADVQVTDKLQLKTTLSEDNIFSESPVKTVAVGANTQVNKSTSMDTTIAIADTLGQKATTMSVGGTSTLDDGSSMGTSIDVTESTTDKSTTMRVGGSSVVDEKTTNTGDVAITDTSKGEKTTSYTFGTKRKLNQEWELASSRTFGASSAEQSAGSQYSLVREKDGKKLQGSLARSTKETDKDISQSNIFGLSGDIDDRWAMEGSFERGDVQSHDGSKTDRNALALGLGYAKTNEETGDSLTSSTKIEARFDQGAVDKRQYLFYNSIEGKISPELSLYSKLEFSKTSDVTNDTTEARHKEITVGGAYRPLMADHLNLLARYTYKEEKSPSGQSSSANIQEERAHIISAEGIYDINEQWQVSERFAYRIAHEKVAGFEFNKTRTWLMIHRLNYKFDKDWSVGGEFRTLSQIEAQDIKRGFLLEVARRVGEYAQLGVGYNFTSFNDDLTELDYTSQGPFVRLTGKIYDQTPEEIARNRQRWIDEKVIRWAWIMVEDELNRTDSPLIAELNNFFVLAQRANQEGQLEEAQQIYKDIIMAGEMMYEEAAEYIRSQINQEEHLREMQTLADQYFKSGQFDKAKEILEKIVEEVEKGLIQ